MMAWYNLYLKRCGELLQNSANDLDETKGTLDYETFAYCYPHITIDLTEVDWPQINKQLTVSIDFAESLRAQYPAGNEWAGPNAVNNIIMYTVLEKVQNIGVQLKSQAAVVSVQS